MLDYTYRLSKIWAKITGKFAKMSLVGGGDFSPPPPHPCQSDCQGENIFFFKWAATSQISNLIPHVTDNLCHNFETVLPFPSNFFFLSPTKISVFCLILLWSLKRLYTDTQWTCLRYRIRARNRFASKPSGSVRHTMPKNNRSVGLKIKPVMAAVQGWMQL